MLKSIELDRCVPRAELDHRARQARLRLERVQYLIAPRDGIKAPWFWRILKRFSCISSGNRWQIRQTRGPLSHRRPRPSHSHQVWPEFGACLALSPAIVG